MSKSDDDVLADLREARDNVLELIKSVTANPKPHYNIDGQEVEWGDYLKMLTAQEKILSNRLIELDPFCEESQWYPGN